MSDINKYTRQYRYDMKLGGFLSVLFLFTYKNGIGYFLCTRLGIDRKILYISNIILAYFLIYIIRNFLKDINESYISINASLIDINSVIKNGCLDNITRMLIYSNINDRNDLSKLITALGNSKVETLRFRDIMFTQQELYVLLNYVLYSKKLKSIIIDPRSQAEYLKKFPFGYVRINEPCMSLNTPQRLRDHDMSVLSIDSLSFDQINKNLLMYDAIKVIIRCEKKDKRLIYPLVILNLKSLRSLVLL